MAASLGGLGCSSSSGGDQGMNGADADTGHDSGTGPGDDASGPAGDDQGSATPDAQGGVDGSGTVTAKDAGPLPAGPTGPTVDGWTNVTTNLSGIASACGSLAGMSAKPDEDMLIASVFQVGLYATRDGGTSWTKLGSGSGSASITNGISNIVYDPTTSTKFWESGTYAPSPFATTDDGVTFTQLGSIQHNDWLSIDFSDPMRNTMLAGGHEQSQTVYRTTNGGSSWNNVGSGLPSGPYCTFPLLIDSMTYLAGCYGSASGIYRTTDGATTWKQVSSLGGGTPPLVASDGSIYWISPGSAGIARSTDKGITWMNMGGSGMIAPSGGNITSGAPVELPDGRIAAMGMQTIIISADHGATWKAATSALPMTDNEDIHGCVYSGLRKAFYVWHNSCSSTNVPSDAVMRYDFDYTTQ
jgi:photosystem II stability/assembly factor-like uncharacterized protein